jgi:hypothetical protein
MSNHSTLGRASRATRVANGRQVVGLRRHRLLQVGLANRLGLLERHDTDVVLGRFAAHVLADRLDHNHSLQARLGVEQVQRLLRVVAHDHLELRLHENERDGLGAQCVVQRDVDQRVVLAGQLSEYPLDAILGEYAHVGLGGRLQTERDERTAQLLSNCARFGVGQPLVRCSFRLLPAQVSIVRVEALALLEQIVHGPDIVPVVGDQLVIFSQCVYACTVGTLIFILKVKLC